MNIKTTLYKIFMSLVILAMLFHPSACRVPPAHAQASTGDIRRDDMLQIAQRYVSHAWNAAPYNVIHGEQTIGTRSWQVDTPDSSVTGGWWNVGENMGVPYQWGGWSALDDNDLHLIPDRPDGLYFDAQLELGYAAGDNYTSKSGEYPHGAGVDCSGFISRVWRTQTKHGTGIRTNQSGLYGISRPIKFEDLRPGDILLTNGHVVLFKQFLTTEKATPNTTRIRVIEASANDWRTSEREYTLTGLNTASENWHGNSYATNQVSLSGGYTNYWPRTYLTPIDIVLVIDSSGSMADEGKMEAAKNSAKMFVDQLRTKDKIGVVSFSDFATTNYQLTEIDANGTVKQAAKAAIDQLDIGGGTSIGGGLQLAQNQLDSRGVTAGVADPVKDIVLLSDGLENVAPFVRDVLPSIIQKKTVVYTIGLGSDADQELLSSIAADTRGLYRFASSGLELTEIYNSILVRVYGGNVARTGSGVVTQGEVVEQSVLVDSSMGTVTFSLSWPGSDLDLTLVKPDGSVIDPAVAAADENIEFVSGPTYEFYAIEAPQQGEWTLQILGVSTSFQGEQYSFSVSTVDAMTFMVSSDNTDYYLNDSINIVASIEDTFLDVTYPQYILGATIEVVAQDSASNTYLFNLYDDGQHRDGNANDGIYANDFTNTAVAGSYNFKVRATGVNNRDQEPFSREETLSIVVQNGQRPESILYMTENHGTLRRVNQATGATTIVGNLGTNSIIGLSNRPGDTTYIYGVEPTGFGGIGPSRLVKINSLTGQTTPFPVFDESTLGISSPTAYGIAISPAASNIAVITGLSTTNGIHYYLWKVNVNTGAALGPAISTTAWVYEVAYNLDGSVLYGVNIDGQLVTVNSATGDVTLVGDPGLSPYIEGLAFRLGDGALFAIDGYDQDRLVRLDPTNGNLVEVIGGLGAVGPNGLAFVPGYHLSISKSGTGSGTVTSNPSGINCSPNCSAVYAYNASITLTATPAAGSTFTGWSGACSGTGSCVVTMTTTRSVTANFSNGPFQTFADVPLSHPYHDDIEILYANGYTGGCSTSPLLFCPDVTMNRAQAAVFMVRGNFGSSYVPVTPTHLFGDDWTNVAWAEGWAESMYLTGLSGGCSVSPRLFCPEEQLTNVQAAVFGLRMKYGVNYQPPAASGTVFADMTDVSFWGTPWAEQAYAEGLLPACGTSGGKPLFCPNSLVNRGFGASIIVKAKNLTMP